MTRPAFIFDIDGTLADGYFRTHFLTTEPKNWEAYFNYLEHDRKIEPVVTVLKSLRERGYGIIFCTARPDTYREQTAKWLFTHGLADDNQLNEPILYMRKGNDRRSDDIVKSEMLDAIRELGKYEIVGVFDDRSRVVKMWQRRGLFVFDVSQGKGDF